MSNNKERHDNREAAKDPILHEDIPTFDESRIKDHPDKLLLVRVKKYFKYFTTGDGKALADLYADDYTMTDIRKIRHRMPSMMTPRIR